MRVHLVDKPNRGNQIVASEEQHRRVGTLAAASLGFAVIQLDVTVVNVAIRQIGSQFGGGTAAFAAGCQRLHVDVRGADPDCRRTQ
jgi:hypothetical protein